MIELKRDALVFGFPEVHADARCRIDFQRTLRIPDDNRDYPLPPGMGRFPVQHVDDFKERLPEDWIRHGGVFLPMYQSEALWINFDGDYPCAVKIAAGKINAVTGDAWTNPLVREPQDYLVVPDQPWLDGFSVGKGLVRQFVAMALGEGYTAEEQLTGEAEHGGVQIVVYPMKREHYEALRKSQAEERYMLSDRSMFLAAPCAMDMGLAPGGLMRQEIYDDDYGFDAWDQSAGSRCFVHITSSPSYFAVTGSRPPHEPPTAEEYTNAGLPWFEYYGGDKKALAGAAKLAELDSVAAKAIKKGEGILPGNQPVVPANVVSLSGKQTVREGQF
jgi:hypothetical protein